MHKLTIAYIQTSWQKTSDAMVASIVEEAHKMPAGKIDILVLPELAHTTYFPITESPENFDFAIGLDHKHVKTFAKLAKELHCAVVFPFFERRAPGLYHNSTVVFEKDGCIAGLYRKSHIPDDPGFYEKYYFTPGDTGICPVKLGCCTLGVLICWDQWFPEAARLMALQGADLLVYPTAIGWDAGENSSVFPVQLDCWKTAMRAHAIANGIPVVAVNRTGHEGHLHFWGNSFICGPDGQIQCCTPQDCNDLVVHTLDLKASEQQRQLWPFLRDRRIDQYQGLLQRWMLP